MALSAGTRLGPYEILEPLGAGGMGAVYRARDTRLDRTVAIKVLPEHLARDPGRRLRLEREARAISSLNHPNICALYDVGTQEDLYFLVMEHLEGETLGAKLARGALPIAEALGLAVQIARALDAAHEKGILHRDLKPSNIHVDAGGNLKLLDFGLAKVRPDPTGPQASELETRSLEVTREGTVLGSPAYMSPEQARGKPVDRQADVWAFGCVLYQMLAGRSAFPGETLSDVLAAVLEHRPDWAALPSSTPPVIRQLLERCLEKDPARRLRDIREARVEMEDAIAASGSVPASRRNPWRIAAVALGAATLLIAAFFYFEERTPPPREAPAPALTQVTFAQGVEEFPAWSPDGGRLAYTAEVGGIRRLFVLDLETGEGVPLTDGDSDEIQPSWSPDGGALLFVRAREPGRKLEPGDVFGSYDGGDVWRLDLGTGRESRVVENAFSPVYSGDGRRIAVDASWVGSRRIWLVDDMGRNPVQLTSGDSEAVSHHGPRWSADGRWIVFQKTVRTNFDIGLVEVASGSQRHITDDFFVNINPVPSPSGDFIYFSSYRSGGLNLWRIPVGPGSEPAGRPQQITRGAGQDVEPALAPGGDRIAFSILKENADIYRLPVSPETGRPEGPPEALVATTREDSRGAWSPDGSRIAFNSDRTGEMNIWVRNVGDGSTRQVTTGAGGDFQPNWSPDGERIAFFSSREGTADIWEVEVSTGALRRLTASPATEVNPFYSPDGGRIAYQSDEGGRMEVWVMDADGSDRRPLTRVGVKGHFLRWTGDGQSVLFRCLCGGSSRTMLAPLDGGEPVDTAEVVGGSHMSWSLDGSRIMDVAGHKVLWVSPLDGGPPESVFTFEDPGVRLDYPVWSPDGRWVLFDRFRPEGGDIWILTGFE